MRIMVLQKLAVTPLKLFQKIVVKCGATATPMFNAEEGRSCGTGGKTHGSFQTIVVECGAIAAPIVISEESR